MNPRKLRDIKVPHRPALLPEDAPGRVPLGLPNPRKELAQPKLWRNGVV